MIRLILSLILVSTIELSFCQDYRKGYVVTNAGDTLSGSVSYRDGHKAFKFCNFKSSEAQSATTYEPGAIRAYGFFNDKVFQSREIVLEGKSNTVFLELIVRGHASLFKFANTFFIEKDSSGLQQLKNEVKEVVVNGKPALQETHQYIGTLNMLLFDCSELSKAVHDIQLNEKALTTLIMDYNRCKGHKNIIYKAKKPWTKLVVGVTAGLNISRLNVNPSIEYPALQSNFSDYKSAITGISFDVFSPRINERLSLHGDVFYVRSKYYQYDRYQPYVTIERDYVTIDLQQIKIPIGIRYTFPTSGFSPYFNIGVSSTFNFRWRSQWIQEIESIYTIETFTNNPLIIPNQQFGIWGSCGVVKSITNKLNAFVELRYEQTNGISHGASDKHLEFISKITNIQLLIGIRTK